MFTIKSISQENTEGIGEIIGQIKISGSVIILKGELGAGKTAFTRGLAKGMGISAVVTSPTFALMNHYPGEIDLYHFDLYRLNDFDEFYELGFDEFIQSPKGICVIEWGGDADILDIDNLLEIDIVKTDLSERELSFAGKGKILLQTVRELKAYEYSGL